MLFSYATLGQKARIFQKLTGLKRSEFESLVEKLQPEIKKCFSHRGRRRKLASTEDQLCLLLIYYRTYVSQEFLGYFVGLHDSNVCRLFQCLEPFVARRIRIKKDRTLTKDKVRALLIDATEQPIQRPKKKRARKAYYSGKKTRHTQKIEITMNQEGKIMTVSKSYPGRCHDFKLRQQSDPLPQGPPKYVDLGYQGLDNLADHVILPHKKPKGGILTAEQKADNRQHSKMRIAIEHKFAQLKTFRILSDTYRNFRRKHHLRFNSIAGIVNHQCGF